MSPSMRLMLAVVIALTVSTVPLTDLTSLSMRSMLVVVIALTSVIVLSILLICSSVAALNSLIVSTTHPENCISSFVVAESSAIFSLTSAKSFSNSSTRDSAVSISSFSIILHSWYGLPLRSTMIIESPFSRGFLCHFTPSHSLIK